MQVQQLVDQSEVVVVEVGPHQQGDEAGDGVRQEQEGPVELLAADAVVVEDQRQEESDHEGEQHRAEGEDQRPHEGLAELAEDGRVGEEPDVVRQADVLLPRLVEGGAVAVDVEVGRADPLHRVDVPRARVGEGVAVLVVDHRGRCDHGLVESLDLEEVLVVDGDVELVDLGRGGIDLLGAQQRVPLGGGDLAALQGDGARLRGLEGGTGRGRVDLAGVGIDQEQREGAVGDTAGGSHAQVVGRGVGRLLDGVGDDG